MTESMLYRVDINGKLNTAAGTLTTGKILDQNFTEQGFYRHLAEATAPDTDGTYYYQDRDLRDDIYSLYLSALTGRGIKPLSQQEFNKTGVGFRTEDSYQSHYTITLAEFNEILSGLELLVEADVFQNFTGYTPPPIPPGQVIRDLFNLVSPSETRNSTLDTNERKIIDALVEYDQNNGSDPEFTKNANIFEKNANILEKTYESDAFYPIKLATVSNADIDGFASANHLDKNQKTKLRSLVNKQKKIGDEFFVGLFRKINESIPQ
jgi:hypothetical protein